MGERTVILADETEYEGMIGAGEDEIWVFVETDDIEKVKTDFQDPAKIGTITFNWHDELFPYEGYTKLLAIITDAPHEGAIGIKLRKPQQPRAVMR